ncbi:hypothetical protein LINGRAHAP2_LOCUS30003 [Linum grandiflorum]
MHAGFVTWLPFHKNPGFDASDSLFRGVIRCVDIAEHSSRVLRQFGYVQVIPEPKIEPEVQKRHVRGVSYIVTFSTSTDSFWGCKTARISLDKIYVPVDETREVAPEYMSWYLPRTHLWIIPPIAGVQIQPQVPLDQVGSIFRFVTSYFHIDCVFGFFYDWLFGMVFHLLFLGCLSDY